MATYTLTPTFDTELLALPSDVQVWYSNDGTNYSYLPAWATSRNGNSITFTSEAEDISITAALYYTSGTRVQDDTATNIPTQGIVLNPSVTADVYRFGTVPNQVTAASTFEVEFFYEAVDPTVVLSAPTVNGVTATETQLTFPTAGGNSTKVWRATVPLSIGDNTLTIDGTTESIVIKRRASLTSVGVANDTEFVAALTAAVQNTTTDEIVVNYAMADIRAALSTYNVNTVNNGSRNSWIKITPGTGSIGWDRTTALGLFRPKANWLCFDGVTVGGPTATGIEGALYLEDGYNAWLTNCTEEYQYDYAFVDGSARTGKDAWLPAAIFATIRNPNAAGTNVYWTNSTIRGDAALRSFYKIVSGIYFDEQRSDTCSNTTVMYNCYVNGAASMDDQSGSPLHQDLMQFWGNSTALPHVDDTNIVVAGMKAVEHTLTNDIQTALFDRASGAARTNVLVKDIWTETVDGYNNNFFQMAGALTNMRISNLNMQANGYLSFRSDFILPEEKYTGVNVHVKDTSLDRVSFATSGGTTVVDGFTAADYTDATTDLNAAADLYTETADTTFYSVNAVTEPVGIFGGPATDNYRTNSGNGTLVTNGLSWGSTLSNIYAYVTARTGSYGGGGIAFNFVDQASRDAALAADEDIILKITESDATVSYYTITGTDLVAGVVSAAAFVPAADITVHSGVAWPADVTTNNWGTDPEYTFAASLP